MVLAGLSVYMSNYISFYMGLGTRTPTSQIVSINGGTSALGFYQVSVYVVFVSSVANGFIWVSRWSISI